MPAESRQPQRQSANLLRPILARPTQSVRPGSFGKSGKTLGENRHKKSEKQTKMRGPVASARVVQAQKSCSLEPSRGGALKAWPKTQPVLRVVAKGTAPCRYGTSPFLRCQTWLGCCSLKPFQPGRRKCVEDPRLCYWAPCFRAELPVLGAKQIGPSTATSFVRNCRGTSPRLTRFAVASLGM